MTKLLATTVGLLFLVSCGTRKLDEASIYEGPTFRLHLVRYHQNLPFHFSGEVFRVQCASAKTVDSPGHAMQTPGWVTVGNGSAIGSKNAAEVVERERGNYLVVDDETLVWLGNGVRVSFDACGSFRAWYPSSLPEDLFVPVDKPDYCAPKGTVTCLGYEFLTGGEPHFDEIRVGRDGTITFLVRSRALRNNNAVRVSSADFGLTWTIEILLP